MTKTLILCSDGTNNTFTQHSSNVTEFIKCLDLRTRPGDDTSGCQQIAFYDQGIGTNPSLVRVARKHRKDGGLAAAELRILPAPRYPRIIPGFIARFFGLVAGYGLRENIKEIVHALWDNYEDGDRVFLIGFSRGAFTVRAVAGLLYSAGLPGEGTQSFHAWFDRAYEYYARDLRNETRDESISMLRAESGARDVSVEFIGIWDTVKSYGGIFPKSLPHLRHNPRVKTVRHALALNERRTWFKHTTWGNPREWLRGVPLEDDPGYTSQDVREVWFSGCHSDVGGGDAERATARIALAWMLGEAACSGLILNANGEGLLRGWAKAGGAKDEPVVVHESSTWWFWLLGLIPRIELDNSERPPRRLWTCNPRGGVRDPAQPPWSGKVLYVHESANVRWKLGQFEICLTRVPPQLQGPV